MEKVDRALMIENYGECGDEILELNRWNLEREFEGIEKEVECVKTKVGILDLSYMGNVIIKGKDAEEFLQYLTTSNIKAMNSNEVTYTFMCYPSGGIIADLVVYKFSRDKYILLLNYMNISSVCKWIEANVGMYIVDICNMGDSMLNLSIEGPNSEEFLQQFICEPLNKIRKYEFLENVSIREGNYLVSRNSYTGEDGFVISGDSKNIYSLWSFIMDKKSEFHIEPIGVKAQNIVRFDWKLPIYGINISEDISPFEAGYENIVDMTKEDFVGKYAFQREVEENIGKNIIYFQMSGGIIPECGWDVLIDGIIVGRVIGAIKSSKLNNHIGIAAIKKGDYSKNDLVIKGNDKYMNGEIISF